ncbi:MAG: N-6 DNA methylase [Candidatus Cloacimonetes bacterium]|nr:N-6 DNA methylase [Candidatus Cloacimonadota bacterium]
MAKAKKDTKVVAKNYKSVILEALQKENSITGMDLTKIIQEELPFLKFESPYKVKAEYVMPTLQASKCFVKGEGDNWSLSNVFENLDSHAHAILKNNDAPMLYLDIVEAVAEKASLNISDVPLSLDENDAFYSKQFDENTYYYISDWTYGNEYAFATLIDSGNKSYEDYETFLGEVISKFKLKKKGLVILLEEDPRFKVSTEGRITLLPKYFKRLKKEEVSKTLLNQLFASLDSGEVAAFSLLELGVEHFDMPFPLTKLRESLEEDHRFVVSGDKVKRSKLSLDKIKALRKKERELKKAEKDKRALLKAQERERKLAIQNSEVEEEAPVEVVEEAAEVVEEQTEDFVWGQENDQDRTNEELKKIEALRASLLKDEALDNQSEVIEIEPSAKEVDSLAFLKRKVSVIKKSSSPEDKDFKLDDCDIDKEEFAEFLSGVASQEVNLDTLTPSKYDSLLRNNLPLRDDSYCSTNPEIAEFMVKLARPRLDFVILDMVCGRGDFLIFALRYLKSLLRTDNAQDLETFEEFCDEQIVGLDKSELMIEAAQYNLAIHGFEISLLEASDSLVDADVLIDGMYGCSFGDFGGFSVDKVLQHLQKTLAALSDGGQAVYIVDDEVLNTGSEIDTYIAENFELRHQISLLDTDGIKKSILHLFKSENKKSNTKIYNLDSLEQLKRVLGLIY